MSRMLLITWLSIIAGVSAKPKCVYDKLAYRTTCTNDDGPYFLVSGLVSDNNDTTYVSLRGCQISGVDFDSFHGLPRLRNLDLSKNEIPRLQLGVLDDASEVTHLNLSYNKLENFPLGVFDQNTKLELLDLKANSFTAFELGIFDRMPRLGFIDLSSNNILGRELSPYLFDQCKDITFIDFSGSDMTETPENLLRAFRRIEFLNLSGCSLDKVPLFATRSHLRTMKRLMLVNNVIHSLDDPNTFKNLYNLEKIYLKGNPIVNLHADIFKPLQRLRSVDISRGQLRGIPDSLFRGLEQLTDVDLSYNLIKYVPVDAFSGTALKRLHLNNNRFTYLAANFIDELSSSGANLVNLELSDNPWQCACLRDIIKEMKHRNVKYDIDEYDGKHKVCVTEQFTCKRNSNDNEYFLDLYMNK